MTANRTLAALQASLERRFRVVDTAVEVDGRSIALLHPASSEDLIDERDFERDERLPYWAELWPSSRVMASTVLSMHGDGRSLLELGCGSGLVSVCAALAGFRVVASDYYEDAVRFTRVNAWRNGFHRIDGLSLDWRHAPAGLPRFDAVVASDVLYERPYGELIASMIERTLAQNGTAFVADPGRIAREDFIRALEPRGLFLVRRIDMPFVEEPIRQTISLLEIGWS